MAIKFLNDVAVDSNVLYVDASTNRVGVNTAVPTSSLHVVGTFSTTNNITTNGNITIDSSGTPLLVLDTGGVYPGATISIRYNGSTSPTMGELSWYENPGIAASQWIARRPYAPYTSSAILLPTTTGRDFEVNVLGTERFRIDSSTGNAGIGTTSPQAKLDVNGGVRMADDTSAASSTNVGTLRYRTSGNNSYVDMVMQTGASTYAWVNIVQNSW